MHRREFIVALASTVTGAHSLTLRAASAQHGARMRRIGVLMGSAESDSNAFLPAFVEELAQLGWPEGRNLRIELRWGAGDTDRISTFARELVELRPDVILCSGTPATAALHRDTRTIPIVFAIVSDADEI